MSATLRKAFVMQVNRGSEAEYTRRHNPIWPDLESVLKAHGAHNYSIFLHRDSCQLFAYVEIESEERWQAIAQTAVCRKWWAHMQEIMPVNPDHSPKSEALEQVFHLD